MTDITNFTFNTSTIRTRVIEGKPCFLARDLCLALDVYLGASSGVPNVTAAMRGLDPDEFQLIKTQLKPGITRKVAFVTEPGLYKFIARSNKPEAKAFDRWVRHTVLPAIRKDGGYVAGEEKLATGEMDEAGLAKLIEEMVAKKMHPDLERSLAA